MIHSTKQEKRIDDFDSSRERDLKRFIAYGKEQSRIAREEAQKEIQQAEARRSE